MSDFEDGSSQAGSSAEMLVPTLAHSEPVVVEVKTARELAELHQRLVESPDIGSAITSFRFTWNMDGDCTEKKIQLFEEEPTEGPDLTHIRSVLDLAFIDRLATWEAIRKGLRNDKVRFALADSGKALRYDGKFCVPPGNEPDWNAVAVLSPRLGAYAWANGGRGVGPDGDGLDELVPNAPTLIRYIVEVVSQLPNLTTFGWECPVLPMPDAVFNTLLQLKNLKDLRLLFSTYSGNQTNLPFWKLARNLEALEIHSKDSDCSSWTIEAAARGGNLKRLVAPFTHIHVFRIPKLLPHWLQIEDWGEKHELKGWAGAARWLRPFLAHASRRQDLLYDTLSSNLSAVDRRLTLQDLCTIKEKVDEGSKLETWGNGISYACVVTCYLAWLVKDDQLAQQVLDAWTAIVERQEADLIACSCYKCQMYLEHEISIWRP